MLKQFGEYNFPTVELQERVFDYLFTNHKEEQFRIVMDFPCMRERVKDLFTAPTILHGDDPHVPDSE
jgi:hypothetical protein